jgi:SAM-dependent methyltransferase
MANMLTLRGSGDIRRTVGARLRAMPELEGSRVIDIPAGSGRLSAVALAMGAEVEAYDLFPESFRVSGLECRRADLGATLPIDDARADLVLFLEAIEHLADPLQALRELNRILRPGGVLMLTTPNVSNLRARVSHVLVESELYNRLPPSEVDGVWHRGNGKTYFGHLFLIGAQRLRTLARLAGFRLTRIHPVKSSTSSLLLAWLYPVLVGAGLFAYRRTRTRLDRLGASGTEVAGEVLRLNLHPTILFGKHLCLDFTKEHDWREQPIEIYEREEAIS